MIWKKKKKLLCSVQTMFKTVKCSYNDRPCKVAGLKA